MHRVRGTVHGGALVAALLGTLIALAFAGGVGAEKLTTAPAGNDLEFILNGGFSPKRLSSSTPSALSLFLYAKVRKPNEAHVQALRELVFESDGTVDVKGLPVCRLPPEPIVNLKEICGSSIVGRGEVTFEIEFLTRNVSTESDLLIVNGGILDGQQVLYAVANIAIPVPAMIVGTIQVQSVANGRFGTRAVLTLPEVVEGFGSLTSVEMRIHKRYRYRGESKSVVAAKCTNGKLRARASAVFAYVSDLEDGIRASGKFVRTCTPRD